MLIGIVLLDRRLKADSDLSPRPSCSQMMAAVKTKSPDVGAALNRVLTEIARHAPDPKIDAYLQRLGASPEDIRHIVVDGLQNFLSTGLRTRAPQAPLVPLRHAADRFRQLFNRHSTEFDRARLKNEITSEPGLAGWLIPQGSYADRDTSPTALSQALTAARLINAPDEIVRRLEFELAQFDDNPSLLRNLDQVRDDASLLDLSSLSIGRALIEEDPAKRLRYFENAAEAAGRAQGEHIREGKKILSAIETYLKLAEEPTQERRELQIKTARLNGEVFARWDNGTAYGDFRSHIPHPYAAADLFELLDDYTKNSKTPPEQRRYPTEWSKALVAISDFIDNISELPLVVQVEVYWQRRDLEALAKILPGYVQSHYSPEYKDRSVDAAFGVVNDQGGDLAQSVQEIRQAFQPLISHNDDRIRINAQWIVGYANRWFAKFGKPRPPTTSPVLGKDSQTVLVDHDLQMYLETVWTGFEERAKVTPKRPPLDLRRGTSAPLGPTEVAYYRLQEAVDARNVEEIVSGAVELANFPLYRWTAVEELLYAAYLLERGLGQGQVRPLLDRPQ